MKPRTNNEYRIFGPPGTGKTTYLTKQIEIAASRTNPNNILVASFTKAAAQELISRDLPIPENNVGTLHAMCFRALGQPTLAEPNAKRFSEAYPDYALTSTKVDTDEGAADQNFENRADELYSQYQIYRAKMVPKESWLESVRGFARAWEDWKEVCGYLDFTDLIEIATRDMIFPPNNTTIGIFDEVQDFTRLEMKLVRQWGKHFQYFLLAGDDDQLLFSFTGATPDAFLYPEIPDERKRFLTQSYRVPATVQKLAEKIISRVSKREPKTYRPRKAEGKIYQTHANYRHPTEIMKLARGYVGQGKSVMILASCAYMLTPIIKLLRDEAVPFSNEYKQSRGDWNPLTPGNGVSTLARINAFCHPTGPDYGPYKFWAPEQLLAWMPLVKAKGVFTHGAKKRIKDAVGREDLTGDFYVDFLTEIFTPEGLDTAAKLHKSWLLEHATAQKFKSMEFPIRIMDKHGEDGLALARKLTVGTIHSVKGAGADVVILLPDLSLQAATQYVSRSRDGYDAILRQFYVAVTRTKEILVIAKPSNPKYCFNSF